MSIATAAVDRRALVREDQLRLGLWMFLGTVTMLFAAFISAYIVRPSGDDWRPALLPSLFWVNTAALAASSLALEFAGVSGRRGRWSQATLSGGLALALGLAFLGGQIVVWRQMVAAGMYLSTNPYSAFVYMMTGAHAVHIVAALAVLGWGQTITWRGQRDPRAWAARMELCRTFWHYLGVVWIVLFALISTY